MINKSNKIKHICYAGHVVEILDGVANCFFTNTLDESDEFYVDIYLEKLPKDIKNGSLLKWNIGTKFKHGRFQDYSTIKMIRSKWTRSQLKRCRIKARELSDFFKKIK